MSNEHPMVEAALLSLQLAFENFILETAKKAALDGSKEAAKFAEHIEALGHGWLSDE